MDEQFSRNPNMDEHEQPFSSTGSTSRESGNMGNSGMGSENMNSGASGPSSTSTGDVWQDVGRQFQALGESLAAAFRMSVNSEDNRRRMRDMQGGLESMVREVDRAISDSMKSPQAQRVKSEAERAAEKVRVAGEQTVQDVRPKLANALRQVNAELQRMIERMEEDEQRRAGTMGVSGSQTSAGGTGYGSAARDADMGSETPAGGATDGTGYDTPPSDMEGRRSDPNAPASDPRSSV